MGKIGGARRLSYLSLLLIGLASGGAAAPASPQEFTAEMHERIEIAKPASRLEIKADLELMIQDEPLEAGVINLHRIYNFCQQSSPEECEATKQEFVDNISAPVGHSELKSLRIIVRDQQYFDYITGNTGIGKVDISQILHRKIGEGLYAILAFDAPTTIALATKGALQDLETSEESAWRLAEKQTRAILPEIPTADQLQAKVVGLELDGYLASLLAFQAEWSKLSNDAEDNIFVAATSDQFILVTLGRDISDMVMFKRSVADDCNQQQRCISPHVYRFSLGRWVIDK